jgi:hypothetical protein
MSLFPQVERIVVLHVYWEDCLLAIDVEALSVT